MCCTGVYRDESLMIENILSVRVWKYLEVILKKKMRRCPETTYLDKIYKSIRKYTETLGYCNIGHSGVQCVCLITPLEANMSVFLG